MKDIWIISDTHFGHYNIIKYCDRPFKNVTDMDEALITNWNNEIKKDDKVYHLGDFGLPSSYNILPYLHGRIRLVLGNHDDIKNQNLIGRVEKVLIWRIFPENNILLTHVPVHIQSLTMKKLINIHGHIHDKESPPGPYINACVEKTFYRPIHLDVYKERCMKLAQELNWNNYGNY